MRGFLSFLLLFLPLQVPVWANSAVVVSYHDQATQAGYQVLQSGGNAFDAFIATTFVQYVLTEGVTSAAGPMAALLYDAKSKETLFLDGYFNNVKDPAGRWADTRKIAGTAIPVPGSIRALEALSKKFGRLSFAQCLAPALELASKGFEVNSLYADLVRKYSSVLQKTEYGRKTFFPNGKAVVRGDRLALPRMASFIEGLSSQGAAYVYRGAWGKELVALVKSLGGKMTEDDLASYEAKWLEPLQTTYRGLDVFTPSGRTYGGLWSLLALNALKNWAPGNVHYSRSPQELETLIRLSRQVSREYWIYSKESLDHPSLIQSRLTDEYGAKLWQQAIGGKSDETEILSKGSHSYHVIVVDSEGNAITGTNTINSLPWADGYFVQGVPVPNSGRIADQLFYGEAGGRRINPQSMHLVFKNGALRFATGAFSGSLIEAELQFLVNLIDYRLNAEDSAHFPRFGSTIPAMNGKLRTYLSSRVSRETVRTLEQRGFSFFQKPEDGMSFIDTGFGNVAIVHEDGTCEGAIAPLSP